jgi:hypothetical protein
MLNAWLAFRAFPWKTIGFAALGLMLASALIALKIERSTSAKLSAQIEKCVEARKADRSAYEKAQAQAKADNLIQVRKIETEQKAKSDAIQSRWDADRARLAELMRVKGTTTVKGPAGPAGSPAVPGTSGGSDGAGAVCIPEGDALSAAENELKLFYLQEWLREQLKVAR